MVETTSLFIKLMILLLVCVRFESTRRNLRRVGATEKKLDVVNETESYDEKATAAELCYALY